MRKIEQEMINAVQARANWSKDNTQVRYNEEYQVSEVFLFGNHIADYSHISGDLVVHRNMLAAYPTPTTKSRLRALGADVYTKNYTTYLDGEPV